MKFTDTLAAILAVASSVAAWPVEETTERKVAERGDGDFLAGVSKPSRILGTMTLNRVRSAEMAAASSKTQSRMLSFSHWTLSYFCHQVY